MLADAIDADEVAMIQPLALELLRSARDAEDYEELARDYDALRPVGLTRAMASRARDVQAALSQRGYHRGPSPTDLLIAAAAETVGAEVWHCDRDFELFAGVTGQPVRRVGR